MSKYSTIRPANWGFTERHPKQVVNEFGSHIWILDSVCEKPLMITRKNMALILEIDIKRPYENIFLF